MGQIFCNKTKSRINKKTQILIFWCYNHLGHMKIIHIADTHWRPLERHGEYRESFKDLFVQAKKLRPDIIVVSGDIIHCKTSRITPEMIEEVVWFLDELSKVAIVYLILGNHDLNLNNKSRQDVISPIVNAMNNEKVILFKQSGNYFLKHLGLKANLCVFSCCDEEGWKNVCPDPDLINIALFHGSVKGAVTDQDYPLGAEVPGNFFDDYDFALLGDIHKKQFLNKRKTIAYPGSTIQQNFGEITEKGFLFWDIRSKKDFDVTFHKVKNNFPFITLDWSGSVEETVEKSKKYPKSSRFRIKSDEELTHVDKSHLENELMTLGGTEVVFYPRKFSTENYDNLVKKKINLRDPEVVYSLFRDLYKEEELSEEKWKESKEIIENCMSKISGNENIARNTEWSLRKIEFSNTFCYGKDNVIDFEKYPGVSGIFAPNRNGKSSILGTILYTLYNTTHKGAVKSKEVVNKRRSSCYGRIEFSSSGTNYKIERSTKNKLSKKTGKLSTSNSLDFVEVGDRSRNDIKRQDTEKEIRSVIGLPEDFILTAMATAGNMQAFIEKKSTARKEIFSRFLDLGIIEDINCLIKEDSKGIQREFKDMSSIDWEDIIKELEKKKTDKEKIVKKLGSSIESKRKEIEKIREKHSVLKESFENIITKSDVEDQEEEVEDLEEKIERINNKIKRNEIALTEAKTDLSKIEKIKTKFSVEENKKRLKSIRKMEKILGELKNDLQQEETELSNKKKSVKKLTLVPCGEEYPSCRFIKDSHLDKKSLPAQKEKIKKILQKVEEQEKELEGLDSNKIEEKIEKYEKIMTKGLKIEAKIANIETEISKNKRKRDDLNNKLKNGKEKLKDLLTKVIDENDREELDSVSEQLVELRREEKNLDKQRIAVASEVGGIEYELKRNEKEKKRYKQIRAKWLLYEKLLFAFSKKGIPALIIKSRLPDVNKEVERILSGIADFKIVLEIDESSNSNDLDIFLEEDGYRIPIELNCGMESTVASIALRVAMINISTLPRPDVLIIDEAFDTLDQDNLPKCAKMYSFLKRWFKNIIVISHNEKLKNMVDHLIEIEKKGKFSHVCQS